MSHHGPIAKSLFTWRIGPAPSHSAHAVKNSIPDATSEVAMCGKIVTGPVVELEFSFNTPACPICVTLALNAVATAPLPRRKLPPRSSYPRLRKPRPIES